MWRSFSRRLLERIARSSLEAMYESMSGDKDAVVQVCACKTLTSLARQDPKKLQPKALEAVTTFFRQYGQGCGRADKDWGWRVAGNTLRDAGERVALDAPGELGPDQFSLRV